MNEFYVYAYMLHGEPLYIGKGKGRRALQHLDAYTLKTSKTYWSKKLRKLLRENEDFEIIYLHENLSEEEALQLEKELILKYGRRDLKTGCLYNTCEGGKGSSGHSMSESGKASISRFMKGRHLGNKFAEGLVHSESTKNAIRNKLIGRVVSEESKKKRSDSLSWQIEKQIEKAYDLISDTWWGKHVKITYEGDIKRQSATSTHRLYVVELDGIKVKRTITDFRQRSCPTEFQRLKGKYSCTYM